MIKEYNINLKNKEKEEKQKVKDEAKQKAKEEKQKAKEEKQKTKEEKQKTKEAKKYIKQNKIKENEVVGTITIQNDVSNNLDSLSNNTNEGCIEIIKSGSKKGLQCGAKKHDVYRCKRHVNLLFNKCLHVEENTTNLTNLKETNNS
jgi:uncharacterized protein (DUF3084 family)